MNGGWPETAQIAAGTAKGNGLIEPVQLVLKSIIDDGTYQEVLDRWALDDRGDRQVRDQPAGPAEVRVGGDGSIHRRMPRGRGLRGIRRVRARNPR